MSIRQKVLLKIKSAKLEKIDSPKKVSSYFGENTFGMETMQSIFLNLRLRHLKPG